MLLASHGWWPWLLLYGAIAVVIVLAVVYFLKRRRATPVAESFASLGRVTGEKDEADAHKRLTPHLSSSVTFVCDPEQKGSDEHRSNPRAGHSLWRCLG